MAFALALSAGAQVPAAEKIDEFSNLACDHYLARMDAAIAEARANPSSEMIVIVYEGSEFKYNERTGKPELVLPVRGSGQANIRSMRSWISHREMSLAQFSFIEGGFREQATVEIWRVPPGSESPKPTPKVEKMKYRQGKARGYCTDCCGPW